MSAELSTILKLEVPIIVQLAERRMTVGEVLALVPGSIVELPKTADEELELMVNNRIIGTGVAVKIGENFGIEIRSVGTPGERVAALGPATAAPEQSGGSEEVDFEALAAAMLEGQL
ncbi:MAG: FliM/FliN family flagellar motor switch protein [Phycisphaerales bacterium]|nr:FliM/FliN family flagellar motor switch protein [Phycisphaerales bacterium]